MKVLIIEDEPATANRLVKLLNQVSEEIELLSVIDSVEDTVQYLKTHTAPELIFMDIHLADGNSFEIFEQVDVSSPIVFTTAYDQYAIKAFKVNSIDYLLKPVKQEDLAKALNKFSRTSKKERDLVSADFKRLASMLIPSKKDYLKRFMIKTGQLIKAIGIDELAYFYVENRIVYAVEKQGHQHVIDLTMEYLENNLDPGTFFRISRSMIVSFASIDSMTVYSKSRIKLLLNPPFGKEAITSSERSASFKQWLSGQ
jgi:DNA-binding LytR/AlgR family response regulator